MKTNRITERVSDQCIILFPNKSLPIKVYKDDNDTELTMSPTIWDILVKLEKYEDTEEQLRVPIEDFIKSLSKPESVATLPETTLEEAYRIQEKKYLEMDAKAHYEKYKINNQKKLSIKLDHTDFEWLASVYRHDYRSNITEDQQWYTVIHDYVQKLASKNSKKGPANAPRKD